MEFKPEPDEGVRCGPGGPPHKKRVTRLASHFAIHDPAGPPTRMKMGGRQPLFDLLRARLRYLVFKDQ